MFHFPKNVAAQKYLSNKLPGLILLVMLLSMTACGSNENVSLEERISRAEDRFQQKNYSAAIIELKNALQSNPDNVDARLLLGKIYLILGDGGAAEKELDGAIQQGKKESEVFLQLAESLILQKKYKPAMGILEKYHSDSENNLTELEIKLGKAYLGLRNSEKANTLFKAVLHREPDNSGAKLGIANVYMLSGQYKNAEEYIGDVLERHPDNYQANTVMGDLAALQKDYNKAIMYYKKLLTMKESEIFTPRTFEVTAKTINALYAGNKVSEANGMAEDLRRKAPGHPLPEYLSALGSYLEGDYPAAKDHLLAVLKVLPDHSPSLFLLGAVSYGGDDLELAEMYLSRFVATAPDYVPGRKLLGATRVKLDQPVEAIDTLLPIFDENTHDAQLLQLMGSATVSKGDHKHGIEYLQKAVAESPGNITFRNELAEAYIRTKQYNYAIKELESIGGIESTVSQEGEIYRSQSLLILAYLNAGDIKKAHTLSAELVGKHIDNPHTYTLLGNVKIIDKKIDSAVEQFNTALSRQPGYIPATIALGNIYIEQGKYQEAKEIYLKSLDKNPNNIRLIMSIALVSDKLKDLEESINWLEKARVIDNKAIMPRILLSRYYLKNNILWKVRELISEAKEIEPDHIAVLQMQGVIKLYENQPQQAVAILNEAIEIYPDRPELYYLVSRAELLNGNIESSRDALKKAISLNNKYLPARLLMASIEMQMGRYQQGERLVKNIKHDFPELSEADNLLGDIYMANRKFQNAANAYAAVPNNRQTPNLILRQARALFKAGDLEKGYAVLETWLKENPDNLQVRTALATEYQKNKQFKEAISHYEQVLKQGVEHPGIVNNLALACSEVGDSRAISFARKAHNLAPENGRITDTLGWILVQNGDYENGLEKLKVAIKQAPDIAEIRYHFARALHMSGDKAAAHRELADLLTSGMNFESEIEAKKLLDSID